MMLESAMHRQDAIMVPDRVRLISQLAQAMPSLVDTLPYLRCLLMSSAILIYQWRCLKAPLPLKFVSLLIPIVDLLILVLYKEP
jgi:hypothetical protein